MKDSISGISYMAGTYSLYFKANSENFKIKVSGFYQNGRSREGLKHSAYMFSVSGLYKPGRFGIGAGLDYLSGNESSKDGKDHAFDILYGARHKYYGHMDYFNNMQKATGMGGLIDPYFQFKWEINPKTDIQLDLHYFFLENKTADPYFDQTGIQYLTAQLGPEADLGISWDMFSILNLKGGYSCMLPTSSMEKLQGIYPRNYKLYNWVWIMITAKPVFIK